jgi:ribosomal protein S18 acetylase RimI-like enzyme
MKYEEITTRLLTKEDIKNSLLNNIVQQAKTLLRENLRDHENTDLGFYEWVIIAQHNDKVVGIITGNKYLPKKAMLCDIVSEKQYRGLGIGIKLLEALCQLLYDNNIPYLIGFTSKKNVSALKTYRRGAVVQDEFVVTVSNVEQSIALGKQISDRLKYRSKKSNLR